MSKARYKITLDNNSNLILYEEVIINNLILIGKQIDDDLYKKIITDNYKATPYYAALQYINKRMRSREEIRTYLFKRSNDVSLIDETISRLVKEGYINDIAFAKAFINDKLNLSNDGPNKIRRSLTNYNIDEETIYKLLLNIDNQVVVDRIDKIIAKQVRLNTKYTGNILKLRIINYLVNLGYDSDIISERFDQYPLESSQNNIQKEYKKLYKKYIKKYSDYKLDMMVKQHLYKKGYERSEIEKIVK
jgi:regulatory protein